MSRLREDALAIFHAAVAAVEPAKLVRAAVANLPADVLAAIETAPRIHVVGGGKACAAMAAGLESSLAEHLGKMAGAVNVPAGCRAELQRIALNEARAPGSNLPTAEGVAYTRAMLDQLRAAGPDDVAICLLSGGGSALLTCPADGMTLSDKITATRQLFSAGHPISVVNWVRTGLSAVKGGRLAASFRGKLLVGLVLSDVVGDHLETIASGPTVPGGPGPRHLLEYLSYKEIGVSAKGVFAHLESRVSGDQTAQPPTADVRNVVVGNNQAAVAAAAAEAARRGYAVLNLGSYLRGDTAALARTVADIAYSIHRDGLPLRPPSCVLMGGETTVCLPTTPGKGGRNTHFAMACGQLTSYLVGIGSACVLSGGTDGEDGPTDAAGAVVDREVIRAPWEPNEATFKDLLDRHDSYTFFDQAGGLIKTGLTGTNVADIRLVLIV